MRSGDPDWLDELARMLRSPGVLKALDALRANVVARIIAALPVDVGVRVRDQPDVAHRVAAFERHDGGHAGTLIGAMAGDQPADLPASRGDRRIGHEVPPRGRAHPHPAWAGQLSRSRRRHVAWSLSGSEDSWRPRRVEHALVAPPGTKVSTDTIV